MDSIAVSTAEERSVKCGRGLDEEEEHEVGPRVSLGAFLEEEETMEYSIVLMQRVRKRLRQAKRWRRLLREREAARDLPHGGGGVQVSKRVSRGRLGSER